MGKQLPLPCPARRRFDSATPQARRVVPVRPGSHAETVPSTASSLPQSLRALVFVLLLALLALLSTLASRFVGRAVLVVCAAIGTPASAPHSTPVLLLSFTAGAVHQMLVLEACTCLKVPLARGRPPPLASSQSTSSCRWYAPVPHVHRSVRCSSWHAWGQSVQTRLPF